MQYLKQLQLTIKAEGDEPAHVKISAIEQFFSPSTTGESRNDSILQNLLSRKSLGEYKILTSDPFFFSVIKLAYACNVDYKTDEAIEEFNEAYKNL